MNMKDEWVRKCLWFARSRADLWTSDQKILRQRKVTFLCWDDSLQLEDAGYTSKKIGDLERNYLHEESRDIALNLWNERQSMQRYGSVSFTTYNHFIKGASIASKQGPCMQSVVLTLLRRDEVAVDVFYRSTEFFKKFPADLVFLRDVLLPPFELSDPMLTCHFANVTVHPMFWATVLPHIDDPLNEMKRIASEDPAFHSHLVKRTAMYVVPAKMSAIANHSQSLRVQKSLLQKIDGHGLRSLQQYLNGRAAAR